MDYYSIVDHLVTLRNIMEECCNNINNSLSLYFTLKKQLTLMPKLNFGSQIRKAKSLEMRVVVIKLYENVIMEFRNFVGFSEENCCNIAINQGGSWLGLSFQVYIITG